MKLRKKLSSYFNPQNLKRIFYILIIGVLLFVIWYFFNLSQSEKQVKNYAKNIYSSCLGNKDVAECYDDAFYSFNKKHVFSLTIKVLAALQDIDKRALGCHQISHEIAEAEVAKDPVNWERVIKKIDFYACNGGYLHGIFEGHALADPKFVINHNSVADLCSQFIKDQYQVNNCVHGMGHLMLVQYKGDLKSAVSECSKLSSGWRYHCYSGIFMENMVRGFLEDHGIAAPFPWTAQNALKLEQACNSFSGLPQRACWTMMSIIYVYLNYDNPQAVYNNCQKAPAEDDAEDCYLYGVGEIEIVSNYDRQTFPSLCLLYKSESTLGKRCMLFAVNTLIYTSFKNISTVLNICSNVQDDAKKNCYRDLASALIERVF
ncbi:MAG TPA: hypothetical protein VG965_02165 [Patescibacteria group bacterium]|nr:hypothetical protein [Patescibacteria group bacterium]